MAITVKLDDLLHARRMTMTELSERIDLTLANVSILKTGKAKAIRFSTLEAICRELECQPGDLLGYEAGAGLEEVRDGEDDQDQSSQTDDDRTAHG
jgi:putative transcriptional regulator